MTVLLTIGFTLIAAAWADAETGYGGEVCFFAGLIVLAVCGLLEIGMMLA